MRFSGPHYFQYEYSRTKMRIHFPQPIDPKITLFFLRHKSSDFLTFLLNSCRLTKHILSQCCVHAYTTHNTNTISVYTSENQIQSLQSMNNISNVRILFATSDYTKLYKCGTNIIFSPMISNVE